MQVHCRNRTSDIIEQQLAYRDPDLDPRGVGSSAHHTVTLLPFHVITYSFYSIHVSGASYDSTGSEGRRHDSGRSSVVLCARAFRGQSRGVASP